MIRRFAALLATIAIAACASMDPDQCRSAKWLDVGYADGVKGQSVSLIENYREDCGKAGVVPDERAWQAGHSRGVLVFCTPENGLRTGAEGSSYNGVCPPTMEAAFLNKYRMGREIHAARSRLSHIDSSIRAIESDLRKRDLPEKNRRELHERERSLQRDRAQAQGFLLGLEAIAR
ncbi:MAG: DUF2799 domain-containing protein [Burkholderiales bacterium]